MGYYVNTTDVRWDIPETPEVLQALKDMNAKYADAKRGGSSTQSWFSWMPADYDQHVTSVKDVFDQLGFESQIIEGPDHPFVSIQYYGDKRGQEDLFLAETAPFMADGSFMEWRGEEGEEWRLEVIGGRMHVREVIKTWGESAPYIYLHYYSTRNADGTWESGTRVIDPYAVPLPS